MDLYHHAPKCLHVIFFNYTQKQHYLFNGFKLLQDEKKFVISYILSVYYDGINFLPISISAQSENELLQNALNIKYQPGVILLQWHIQVV